MQQALTNVHQRRLVLIQTLVMTVSVHQAKQCECKYVTRLMTVSVIHVDQNRTVLIKQVATSASVETKATYRHLLTRLPVKTLMNVKTIHANLTSAALINLVHSSVDELRQQRRRPQQRQLPRPLQQRQPQPLQRQLQKLSRQQCQRQKRYWAYQNLSFG